MLESINYQWRWHATDGLFVQADAYGRVFCVNRNKKPAREIRCVDEENKPIKVKIYETSEFENRLASFFIEKYPLFYQYYLRALSQSAIRQQARYDGYRA